MIESNSTLVTTLREAASAGGKARGLVRLIGHGFDVPRGFCVTIEAYRRHLDTLAVEVPRSHAGDDFSPFLDLRERIQEAPMAEELRAAIEREWRRLGATSVAVRSSATAEDLPEGSFAGLHDTVLEVNDLESCFDAVKQCWASLFNDRACSYRAARDLDSDGLAMGVIVQELVPAEAAGVLFTVDPRGDRGRLVIEACRGLGEALVSGRVKPDRFVVERDSGRVVERTLAGSEPSLPEDAVEELTRLGLAIERSMGAPQDLEWAYADGKIHLLQSRPITTRPITTLASSAAEVAPSASVQVWSNVNAGEVAPDVVTPLTWSVLMRVETLIRRAFRRCGIETDGHPIVGRIAGRLYFNLTTFAGILRKLWFLRGVSLERLLGGAQATSRGRDPFEIPADQVPEVRAGVGRFLLALPGLALWGYRHRLALGEPYLARLAKTRKQFEAADVRTFSDSELVGQLSSLLDVVFEDESIFVFPSSATNYYLVLDVLCRRWLESPTLANALLAGHGGVSSAESGLELWRLSVIADQAPAVRDAILGGCTFSDLEATLGDEAPFFRHWCEFMADHGHHVRAEIELSNARWSEDPDYVLTLVRGYLEMKTEKNLLEEYEERARDREDLMEDAFRRLGPLRRRIFRSILQRARLGSALRENIKSECVHYLAVARAHALELGRRLVERDILGEVDDVFFLFADDLSKIVADPDKAWRERVAQRREEYRRHCELRPPPVVYGDFDPRSVEAKAEPRATLHGFAVSPGVVRGRARVILRASADETVQAGEILVAPFTDPGWVPYFLPAAGIVMDLGGLLSHGSIVAREYGIPAVVNVGPATEILQTGQMIEVDGDRGEVRVLDLD